MPKQVFVKHGHQSPADLLQKARAPFDLGPTFEDSDGSVTFESRNASLCIQLNTPRERFDQMTGQKVRDENKVIKFKMGLFVAKTEEEIKAIVGSKYYGAPNKSIVWRRTERQKAEVKAAVRDLGVQLKTRPDLMNEVAALLKTLPGGESLFALPSREVPAEEPAKPAPSESNDLAGL